MLDVYVQAHETIINFRNMGLKDFYDSKFDNATNIYQQAYSHRNKVCHRWIGIRTMIFNTYLLFLVYFIPILVYFTSMKDLWGLDPVLIAMAVSTTMKLTRLTNSYLKLLAGISKLI